MALLEAARVTAERHLGGTRDGRPNSSVSSGQCQNKVVWLQKGFLEALGVEGLDSQVAYAASCSSRGFC